MTRLTRTSRPMAAVMLVTFLTVLGLPVVLGLREGGGPDAPSPESKFPGDRTSGSIVSLGYGRTMVAPKGTVARDIVAWLGSGTESQRYFEAGGREFVGNSDELAPDSWNRIERFAMMLKANHDARARIVGFSDASGNAAEDQRLSEARARRVMIEISRQGIAPSRLSFEGRGSANPIADNATQAVRAQNRRVAVILSRGR